jgi:hypothetical protein
MEGDDTGLPGNKATTTGQPVWSLSLLSLHKKFQPWWKLLPNGEQIFL